MALRRLGQQVLAPGADRRLGERLEKWVPGRAESPADLVLDLGSGSESRLSRLPRLGARSVAVDVSFSRVAAAARAGAMAVAASAVALPFRGDSFQAAVGVGLLHHLPDDEAARAVREMARVTAVGGHTVVLDAVVPEPALRRPLAAIIRHFDRGRWMRRQQEIESLLESPEAWTRERFTYALTGLEALVAQRRKES
jgi:SAM-dependent methyltransferase